MQDLARFAREARENYASAIGKAAFRERIEDAAGRALNIWRDAVERTDAARQPLETLSTLPRRFGEVQVRSRWALMRALHEQKRPRKSQREALTSHTFASPSATVSWSRRSIRWLRRWRHCRPASRRTAICSPAWSIARRQRGDPYVGEGKVEAGFRAALRG